MSRSVSKIETPQSFAHRANIERYKKLLATHLADNERKFVQLRIAEEEAALRQIDNTIVPWVNLNHQ